MQQPKHNELAHLTPNDCLSYLYLSLRIVLNDDF